jgi:uncharacterized protein involved in exopolysaccharide biosynthesis
MSAAAELWTPEEAAVLPDAGPNESESNPLSEIFRMMRGRWIWTVVAAATLAPCFAAIGYLNGVKLYESQAILRVFPQESNILYQTGDDSVLKTFDSFVKAETTYVASNPVMGRAVQLLRTALPDLKGNIAISDLAGSVEIRRSDSLIVLKTLSRDASFSAAKLDAVIGAYMALKKEAEEKRSEVRLEELLAREAELLARQREVKDKILEVSGEFGLSAIAKAHVEKIAQIDALTARRTEVAATLVALEAEKGAPGADLADQEILRATLLDRALADLNFERAKRQAELSTLLTRYTETAPIVRDKRRELEVIESAMEERREQIKVLSQTGALTDQSAERAEANVNDLRALLDKITGQLATLREEARILNANQLELRGLEEKAAETQDLLEETWKAIEVIRLEGGRALPGYTVVMSPPVKPDRVAEDTGKMLAAGGFAGGAALAFAGSFALALFSRRIRYSDDLKRWTSRLPLLTAVSGKSFEAVHADRLRNALQLFQLRAPQLVGRARVIGLVRLDSGNTAEVAQRLAESFARARLNTLLVDASQNAGELTRCLGLEGRPGWRELVAGEDVAPLDCDSVPGLSVLPLGDPAGPGEETVSVAALRAAIAGLANGPDVVLISAGSLHTSLTAELVLSACDLGLAEVWRGDNQAIATAFLERLDDLPRQGGAITFRGACRGDPALAAA